MYRTIDEMMSPSLIPGSAHRRSLRPAWDKRPHHPVASQTDKRIILLAIGRRGKASETSRTYRGSTTAVGSRVQRESVALAWTSHVARKRSTARTTNIEQCADGGQLSAVRCSDCEGKPQENEVARSNWKRGECGPASRFQKVGPVPRGFESRTGPYKAITGSHWLQSGSPCLEHRLILKANLVWGRICLRSLD